MKILGAEYNDQGEVALVPMGDDVLLRNNGDFYIPEFTQEVSGVPQLVVKICKLGKGVTERFACRYYNEIGVGVRFYADTLEDTLRQKGLPLVVASSFDNAAAISGLKPWTGKEKVEYEMELNGKPVFQASVTDLPVSVDRLIVLASRYHLLKIGDYLFCGNPCRFRVKAGDEIRMKMDGAEMSAFRIK